MESAFCWYILVFSRGRMLEITTLSVATLLASSTAVLKSDKISVVLLVSGDVISFSRNESVFKYQDLQSCFSNRTDMI